MATTTTDANGRFQLDLPDGFALGPNYIVRAKGVTEKLDARVIDLVLAVDPVSDAASEIVTLVADDLSLITIEEATEILEVAGEMTQDVDPAGMNTSELSAALVQAMQDSRGANNLINAVVAAGQICGHVEDADGKSLAGIRMVARDYRNHDLQNRTRTDAKGDYCLNVSDGAYIVGAMNDTDSSYSASGWWTAGGTTYSQTAAEKIAVAGTSVVADFALEDGARIKGTVKAGAGGSLAAGSPIENVTVSIRNYDDFSTIASKIVKSDGVYRLNLIPGSYSLAVINTTSQLGYASEFFDGGSGSNDMYEAKRITLDAGQTVTVNVVLSPGYLISGQVLDAPGGSPLSGIRVRVDITDAGSSERIKTDNQGRYQLWVAPDTYDIAAYGSRFSSADVSAGDYTADFTGPVGTVAGLLKDGSGESLGWVKLFLRSAADASVVNQELSDGDGAFTLYSATGAAHLIEIRVDNEQIYGSSIYLNETQLLSGTPVTVTLGTENDLGTITLPTAGVGDGAGILRGKVTVGGVGVGNASVQVRDGGTTSDFRFVTTSTKGDGTYILTLPAGAYDRVRATAPGGTGLNADTVTIVDGSTTTRNFSF